MNTAVPLRHLLLAVAIMAIWGSNFTVAKLALADFPPFLFAGLRFFIAFLPAALFFKRPNVPWSNLAAYGMLIGLGQFGLLFFALNGHISPGIASVVLQMQVLFTMAAAAVFNHERIAGMQWVAVLLSLSGLGVILSQHDGFTAPFGLMLAVAAAMCWAMGNMMSRAAGRIDMVAYVVWASLFAFPPLFAISYWVDGPVAIVHSISHATLVGWLGLMWQTLGNTLFGYVAWAWLLSRYPAASIAPLALMVPVFGMATSAFVLHEPMPGWKLMAAALVMGGLMLGVLWPLVRRRGLGA